jgi:HK97 family phage portal protein
MSDSLLRRIGQSFAKVFTPGRRFGIIDADGAIAISPIGDVTAALQSAAVWACCRLISEAVSTLAVHIFRVTPEGKDRAINHPYWRMLTTQPNPLMTTPQWVQTTVLHLMLYGNAYTLPEWIDDEVVALWPVPPDRVRIVQLAGGSYVYRMTDASGRSQDYAPLEILHFRLFSLDGIVGLSPIEYHRLSFQIDGLTRLYSATLYTNGGRPSGVLKYPGNLSKEQIAQIRQNWKLMHSGPTQAGGVAVLEGGTEYQPLAIPPEQLQFIEQQRFSIEQIARLFGVPPHLIGADNKPTYASVEQQSLEFRQYRIQPIVTNLERTIQAALLEAPYSYRFNLAAFERSDIKTRYAAYAVGRQWGWLSVNDIRELEDFNSIGPEGDVYLTPLNMKPADAAAGLEEPTNDANAGLRIQEIPAA